jgi:hypothetical protein
MNGVLFIIVFFDNHEPNDLFFLFYLVDIMKTNEDTICD